MRRALELAARGAGNTSPNPPVGAVVVRDGVLLGEGYHHRAGGPHAELQALRSAGDARGSTVYVTLEPCDHHGKTPPCTAALIDADVARVVVGTCDPNPRTQGAGAANLRAHGIAVDVLEDADARELVVPFARAVNERRVYLTLKMAVSLDGFVAPAAGSYWLSGDAARDFVRELRATHDGVLVGAGTVRIDDPQLTVRPPQTRVRPYVRIVACEREPVPATSRIFERGEGDGDNQTIVLAPGGACEKFRTLETYADVLYAGDGAELDLRVALRELWQRGLTSVLCEGGPTLAARLLALGLVDRILWIVAPRLLAGASAVPALARGASLIDTRWDFTTMKRYGDDVLLELRPLERCSPA